MMIVYERATSLFLYGFVHSDVGSVANIVHKSIVISLLNSLPCSQYTVGQPACVFATTNLLVRRVHGV
jgi:hypothetical protein